MNDAGAGVRVRGRTLHTDWHWLAERAGKERSEELRAGVPAPLRQFLPPAPPPRWAPIEAVGALTLSAAALLGEDPVTLSRGIGRANADRYDRPVAGYLIRMGLIESGFRNPGYFWGAHYDRGRLSLEIDEPGRKRLRLDGFTPPAPCWCARVFGFVGRLLELARQQVTREEHPECAARGGACCRYEFRYEPAPWP